MQLASQIGIGFLVIIVVVLTLNPIVRTIIEVV